MSVRSPRLRATLYAIPIPITIALVAGSSGESSGQYLGVILLVGFMYAVAALQQAVGRMLAVAGALLGYLGIAAALHQWADMPSWMAFSLAVVALAALRVWNRRHARADGDAPDHRPPGLVEYAVVPIATSGTWALGTALGPFLVTFPYSGVPTALSIRSGRLEFAVSFAGRAWLLLGFLGAFHVGREQMSFWPSLGVAWVLFAAAALGTHRGWTGRRASAP
ncbi:hypothetical protein [Nocardioides ferulae]|uniref:hypothetical protein n=1 Tax=Nocardioides ferulae TaxID=2340821 RepID=UPI000EAC617D|nr:hypothetical protein [Nocardioides ferulae]